MNQKNFGPQKGFTIIEVVLVLEIAGLIFLMVFVALPTLQRSQRDTQRRNDIARVGTALAQYQTNNQGTNENSNLPPAGIYNGATSSFSNGCNGNSACRFIRDYMNSGVAGENTVNAFQDPDGTYYNLTIRKYNDNITKAPNMSFPEHMIYITTSAVCNGEDVKSSSSRDYAVQYRLEGSGVFCSDNQ